MTQRIALSYQESAVISFTGGGEDCSDPIIIPTGGSRGTVYVNSRIPIKYGDQVYPHSAEGCEDLDTSQAISSKLSTVYFDGLPVIRAGDYYGNDNFILKGSDNFFIG